MFFYHGFCTRFSIERHKEIYGTNLQIMLVISTGVLYTIYSAKA